MAGTLLVTGGTGTIGSHLVNYLKQSGDSFKVMVRNAEKADALEAKGIPAVQGNFSDPDSLFAVMKGIHRAFILTPSGPDTVPWQTNAIEAARDAGVRHVVKLSALGANEESDIQIMHWHGATERILKESGVAYTIIRPHNFMQNWLMSADSVKAGTLYGSTGDMPIPHIDARDIAEVAYRALTGGGHKGETYTITGPEALSNAQVAEEFSKALNEDVRYVNLSHEIEYQGMLDAGLPEWLASDLDKVNRRWADGHDVEVTLDAAKVMGHAGRTVADFIDDHLEAFS